MNVQHIALTVKDLEKSKTFYCDNFGFTFVNQFEKPSAKAKFCYLINGEFKLELWEFDDTKQNSDDLNDLKVIGIRHLAFSVDNVSETVETLNKKGFTFSAPATGASGKEYSLGTDPNGIALEVIQK